MPLSNYDGSCQGKKKLRVIRSMRDACIEQLERRREVAVPGQLTRLFTYGVESI